MTINLFKISPIKHILILAIGLPAGFLIYQYNSSKVNFIATIDANKLTAQNYCWQYDIPSGITLLGATELKEIQREIKSQYSGSYKRSLSLGYVRESVYNGEYKLFSGGAPEDLALFEKIALNTAELIVRAEERSYKQKFSKYLVICDGRLFPLFNSPLDGKFEITTDVFNVYSKGHLIIGSLSPVVALYLLIIILEYVRSNAVNLKKFSR